MTGNRIGIKGYTKLGHVNSGDSLLSSYAGQGDPEIWDNIWKNINVARKEMYAAGAPLNITQLMHRGYFEDLWYYMGDKASSAGSKTSG